MSTTRAGLRKRGASVPAPHPPHHVNDMQGGPKATLRGATADWDVVYSTFAAGACVTIGALAYIAYWQRVPAILRSVCWLQASIHSYCSALTCVRPLRLGLGCRVAGMTGRACPLEASLAGLPAWRCASQRSWITWFGGHATLSHVGKQPLASGSPLVALPTR